MMPTPFAGDTVIPTKTSSTKTDERQTSVGEGRRRPSRAKSNPVARKRQLEAPSLKAEVPRKSQRHGEPVQDDPKSNDKLQGRSSRIGNASPVRTGGTGGSSLQTTTSLTGCHSGRFTTGILREDPSILSDGPEPRDTGINGSSRSNVEPTTDQREVHESSSTTGNVLALLADEKEKRVEKKLRLERKVLLEAKVTRETKESITRTQRQRLGYDSKTLKRSPEEDRPCDAKVRRRNDGVSEGPLEDGLFDGAFVVSSGRSIVDDVRRQSGRFRKTIQWLEEGARRTREDLAATRAELHEERKAARLAKREFDSAIKEVRSVEVVKHRAIIAELKARLSQSSGPAGQSIATSTRAEHLKDENHRRELSAAKKRLTEAEATIRRLKSSSLEVCTKINDSNARKMEAEMKNLRATNKKLEERLHMRQLRETERSQQLGPVPRVQEKITNGDRDAVDLCKAIAEIERLRELVAEQQEVIEVLGQVVKEKERKLDQLTKKRRKEEFYRQWLELEPVAEVDNEEEGDSAPSSLSPQPSSSCAQWQAIAITREAYEAVLFELEELRTKLLEERQGLTHAKSQVRDLERALLQETRGSRNSGRALSDKLRQVEEQKASLLAEIAELREQNELLEFRVFELEETRCTRDTPDPADSGVVTPEPIHLYKDQPNKHGDRAVATVIPYNAYVHPVSPIPQKPPLSLQESGIFEEEEDPEVELASRGTQTEAPVGELLQEVQRLHELRARIQERAAVKVPVPVADAKSCSSVGTGDSADGAQITIYQERIYDLEERLRACREAEERYLREKQLSKQREEELLNENYELTERIFWFENELRNFMDVEKREDTVESTMLPIAEEKGTSCSSVNSRGPCEANINSIVQSVDDYDEEDAILDDVVAGKQTSKVSTISQHRTVFRDATKNLDEDYEEADDGDPPKLEANDIRESRDWWIRPKRADGECVERKQLWADYNEKLEHVASAEHCARDEIVELKSGERAFMKTLRRADTTSLRMESDCANQLEDLTSRSNEKASTNRRLPERLSSVEEMIRERQEGCVVCRPSLLRRTKEDPKKISVDEVDRIESVERGEDNGKIVESTMNEVTTGRTEVARDTEQRVEDSLALSHAPARMNESALLQGQKCATTAQRMVVRESAGVSLERSEATKATQTDEFAAVMNCRCSVDNNQRDVSKQSTRTVVQSNLHDRITVNVPRGLVAAEEVPEIAAEATENAFTKETVEDANGAVSQVRVVPEENPAEEIEAVVTFTESEPDKKDKNG